MSVRQQRRAMAEARARRVQVGGAAGGVVQDGDAADASGAPAAPVLRTPAAQIGLQVMPMCMRFIWLIALLFKLRLQDMRLDSLHKEGKHDFTKASRNQVKVRPSNSWSAMLIVCLLPLLALQLNACR